MYYDIISYQLADGVTHDQLVNIASRIIDERMADLPGFISREIAQDSDDNYTDIVRRESAEAAAHAEEQMDNIPNAAERYSCYNPDSITSKNLTVKVSH
ncbi:MAG: hypothetical protein H6766_02595 [Candidatus Peribacteria bacterium]|nr:MAG: hypothetical protein H6766_02595 [Candidatus Peribacteria bacterium]